jgi:hypothetical protein
MSILNLNAPQGRAPRSKKATKVWLGVGLLIAVLGIGSTFAASITINGIGNTTEFGQGVERTVFCGGSQSITVAPVTTYRNSSDSTAGSFWLSGIVVSNVPIACDGVDFEFSVYDATSNDSALTIATVNSKTASTPTVYWRSLVGSSLPIFTSANRSNNSSCQAYGSAKTATFGGLLSLSNTSYSDPCGVAYLNNVTATSFQINFQNGGSTTSNPDVATNNMSRIVVQSQPDTFGATATAGSSPTYGLVNS